MDLLERDAELAAIDSALEAAASGVGTMLVVEGPAGIGKSALLDEARRRALARGVRVYAGHAGVLERDLAHGVVRQLFEQSVRADPAVLLAGAAELARPVVLPEVAVDPDTPPDRRAPVVHGLYWLTANAAQDAPLLLTVDDAQWSDAASLRYLAYLARRLDGLPVVVLVAVRTGEAPAEDAPLAELRTANSTRVLRPGPLTQSGVSEVVHRAMPFGADAEFAAACREATGGVPFLLDALLGALESSPGRVSAATVTKVTSATVGHATLLRLNWLADDAVPVARAVAVLGRHATVRRIAALAGLSETEALRSCDVLASAHILRAGQPIEFVHPIVQSSVYDELPAGERSRAHARVADLLTEDGEPVSEVAAHLAATAPGTAAGTVATLRLAAARALARGAPESAIAYLRRCVAEPPPASERAEVLHELARAEAVVRDPQASVHLRSALDLVDEPTTRARIAFDLVETWMFAGRWDAALAEVERALTELGGRDDETAAHLEVFRAGMIANDPRLVDVFERDRPLLTRLAAGDGRPARLMSALLASCAVCRIEAPGQVRALAERGLDGTRLMTSADADAWGPQSAATLAYLGRYDQALAAADLMRTAARERGSVYGFVRAAALRALVQGLCGDLRGGEADLRSAFELAQDHELMFSTPPLLRWSVDVLIERPQVDDIARSVEQVDLDPGLEASFSGAWLLETRGRLRLARGELDEARADLVRCGETMTQLHTTNPMVTAWRSALALCLPEAERGEARRLAAAELELAQATALAHPIGVALRTVGLLCDDVDERIATLQRAVDVSAEAASPVESARTQAALGVALRRSGQRSAAGDTLRAALDLAHRCGAERTAARAEVELHALGARPRRRASSGVDALTPSEARVAAQAAAGMTNREIAQALFVTSKTVENQLSRVYQKLGVRGRDELGSGLDAPGAVLG